MHGSKLLITAPSGRSSPKKNKMRLDKKAGNKVKTRTILFVLGTRKGNLARRLREVMGRIKHIVGFNAKIVEKAGKKLRTPSPITTHGRDRNVEGRHVLPASRMMK